MSRGEVEGIECLDTTVPLERRLSKVVRAAVVLLQK